MKIKIMNITKLVVDNPKKTIILLVLISLSFCLFIPRIIFQADIRDMIPADDPVVKDMEETTKIFGSQNILMAVLRSDNIFTVNTLKKIHQIEEGFSDLPGVDKVTTPLNINLIESSEFLITIAPIVEHIPENEEEVKKFKEKILMSPTGKSFVTENGKAALMLIALNPDVTGTTRARKLVADMLKIIAEREGPEKIYLAGESYQNYYIQESITHDLYFLFGIVAFIVILLLYLCFRSIQRTILLVLTILMGTIWVIGLMALIGFPMTMISVAMPAILVAVSSAYGIHILNKYYEIIGKGLEGKEAVLEAMRGMNSPVVMAALTTAAGFLALISSFVTPIRQFGISTAFGVLAAVVISLTFIPAVLVLQKAPIHLKKQHSPGRLVFLLRKMAGFVTKRAKIILLSSFLLLGIFLLGIPRINIESNPINYFGKDSPVVQAVNIVENEFGGSLRLMIVLDTEKEGGIKEPKILRQMIEIQEYLNSLEHVSNSFSLADLICKINQAFHGGEKSYYAIPDTREAVAQELLLFSMQEGLDINSLVSHNFQKALISAQMKNVGGKKMEETIDKINKYLEENFNNNGKFRAKLVGMPRVVISLIRKTVSSQMSSIVFSILAVAAIVSLLFTSTTAGFICVLPLLFTIGINFGVMGYFGNSLNIATAMISSIAIGIGVDYSIHFLSRYKEEIKKGKNKVEALIVTAETAGQGIFFNAITLILGFGVLLFSSFRAISTFGYLVSLTMLISSLASLTVIPAILRLISCKFLMRKNKKIKN